MLLDGAITTALVEGSQHMNIRDDIGGGFHEAGKNILCPRGSWRA